MSKMYNTCRMSSTEKKETGNNKRSPFHNGSALHLGWSQYKDTANMKLRQIQTRMYLIWKKQIKVISRLKCTQYLSSLRDCTVTPTLAHVGRHAIWMICTATYLMLHRIHDSFSDVGESRVRFASKNLTPCRMHWNAFLIAQIIAKCYSFPNMYGML